jgi:hypothetical protein
MTGPEITFVEQPLIGQLVRMGWKHTTSSLSHPSVSWSMDDGETTPSSLEASP